jgi:molecular chaperone GrpE (heat shock protein)
MGFKIAEIREILGEAYTDDIGKKLVTLHRSVVDPLLDDLDSAKRDATKYKTEADKVPGLQKDLDEAKKGEDWKTKFEKAEKDLKDYKDQIARDAETAKVKAAYKKLLTEEKISEKSLDAVLNVTDYSKMKLKEDGTLDGIEDLKKDIDTRWGGFKVQTRQRGEKVDTPPAGGNNGGGDNSIRTMTAAWHAAKYGAAPQNSNQ